MTPAEIRAPIAASDGSDQGAILEEAWELFAPQWGIAKAFSLARKFGNMLEAQAHTDAALLIFREALPGWDYAAGTNANGKGGACHFRAPNSYGVEPTEVEAPTPALAILDAVCAAKGG